MSNKQNNLLSTQELNDLTSEFTKGLLGDNSSDNMCFTVCTALQGFLSFSGVDTELVKGDFQPIKASESKVEHYWLSVIGDMIIDPTADQLDRLYGLPKLSQVYVGVKPEWYPTNIFNMENHER
ncbi:MAG: hypothetical protein ACJAS1_000810 [Oleiphilaceae bacterium]